MRNVRFKRVRNNTKYIVSAHSVRGRRAERSEGGEWKKEEIGRGEGVEEERGREGREERGQCNLRLHNSQS